MEPTTLVGLLAAFCTTSAFIPQVIQILKTGNTDGISLMMYAIFTTGVSLWLIYGLIMNDLPMILANLITLILACIVLGLTLYQRMADRNKMIDSGCMSSDAEHH
ncbi:SemiSWEET transporter [Oceanospirillum sediminis]|uniref:SemiSWEET transporter n=1 Tax=Oceanospirillum sediminis TaxID=2760088 RepID=A0A839IQR6_9GAMM|nr:SemiSWEET transporter [Oceanospirillum sediminis]MBB1487004.1 SemiSWEET transporter [Oceanospirillum sediminis]